MMHRAFKWLLRRGGDSDPRPRAPEWAVKAGLPPPEEDEKFSEYMERLGVGEDELGKTTANTANVRFFAYLTRTMPDHFEEHMAAKRRARWQPIEEAESRNLDERKKP